MNPQAASASDTVNNQQPHVGESDKSYVAAVLLAFFLGGWGVDRLYLGHIGTGVLKLLTAGGFGIWALIDFILIAFGKLRDKQGRELRGYRQHHKGFKIFAIVALVLSIIVIPAILLLTVFMGTPALQKNSRDTQRKNDLSVAAAELSEYQSQTRGVIPSDTQFAAGTPPLGDLSTLQRSDIVYHATPDGCDNASVRCRSFTLSTRLENGQDYRLTQ